MMLCMAHIITLTLNPSVDVLTTTAQVLDTHKLRCTAPQYHPGGGGINVARVVHRLGGSVHALWLGGGGTGDQLSDMLDAEAVPHQCIACARATRMGFSVHETQSGRDFRFVMPGPTADPQALNRVFQTLSMPNPDCRYWVVSGSLPPDAPTHFYADIAQLAQAQQKKLVLDASGPALMAAMRVGVYMVKPSLREMEEAVGKPLPTLPQRLTAAREWLTLGWCQVVALSLGAEGALLVTAQGAWHAPGLDVPVRSTIGAGDTFVGAFVATLDQMHPDTSPSTLCQALRHAMAASAAALAALGTALCQAGEVANLLDAVQVIALED
jgi:6-phosphofructokinase 2